PCARRRTVGLRPQPDDRVIVRSSWAARILRKEKEPAMATSVFPPQREPLLVPFSLNFKTKITASPTTCPLTAGQATAYGTLHEDFVTKWNICQVPSTKTKSAVEAKN